MKTKQSLPEKQDGLGILTGDENHLRELGLNLMQGASAVRDALNQYATKWIDVCKWIREKSISPVRVRQILSDVGFNDSRISEFNRISQVNDEMWAKLSKGEVGKQQALMAARNAMETDLSDLPPPAEGEADGEGEGEGSGSSDDQETKDAKKKLGLDQAAKKILVGAEFFGWKSKTWNLNGFKLVLKKVPSKIKKGSKSSQGEQSDESGEL